MLETGGDNHKRLGQLRNRPTNRRNSRDRLDRANSLGDNGGGSVGGGGGGGGLAAATSAVESRVSSGIGGNAGPGEPVAGGSNGFSCVEAAQVMSERWVAAINALNNPSLDASERPVVYSSSEGGSVWGSSKLPFQVSVSDFIQEMGQAVLRSNSTRANHIGYSKSETASGGHN